MNDPQPPKTPSPLASRWRQIKRILSGVIGVQSDEVQEQDAGQDSLETYAMKIALGLLVFVLVVALIAW